MSEIKVNSVVNSTGDNDSGLDLSTNDQVIIKTANTTAMTIDSSQNTSVSGDLTIPDKIIHSGDTNTSIRFPSADTVTFETGGSERARVDSSGNLHVAVTSTNQANVGISLNANGNITSARDGGIVALFNRLSSDGEIISFRKDGSTVGKIGSVSGRIFIGSDSVHETFIGFNNNYVYPADDDGAFKDNAIDLGNASARYDDVFATNGTINTSDQQEKNTIEDSDLGLDFVKRLSPKSYIFNGKTRTHYGLIAQDVETVLSDINKATSGFAGFIKDDISEEQDGSQYRYGLRYTEFVAPLIKAIKEQQTIIEDLQARITKLENAE